MSQDEIALRTGKSRAAVRNFLRLLQLPPRVQETVRRGKLTLGHAKVLLALLKPPLTVVVIVDVP